MKTNIKYIASILVVVAVIFTGVVIRNQSQSSTVIKIGLVGPFSGKAAAFGEFMNRGLALTSTTMNAAEFSAMQIIKADDMCDGKTAVSAVQKLIEVDHVNYIIGPLCNAATLSTEKLFEDNKVISISIGLPSNQIANMGPYHFAFSPEIEFLMKRLAGYVNERGLKNIAIIHTVSPMEEENYSTFRKHFTAGGGTILSDQSIVKGQSDFRDTLAKVKAAKPDAIMISVYGPDLVVLLKQMADLKLSSLPRFGIHALQTPDLKDVMNIAEGIIYPYPSDNNVIASAADYATLYQSKYGTSPDMSSINVYDSLNILNTAIKECGYSNKDCVREKLANLKDYEGANGNLTVDARGVGTYKEIMLKTIKDGKFVKL